VVARALGAASTLARWGVRGGGLLMLAAALLVSFDVIMRRVFNFTTGGADELSATPSPSARLVLRLRDARPDQRSRRRALQPFSRCPSQAIMDFLLAGSDGDLCDHDRPLRLRGGGCLLAACRPLQLRAGGSLVDPQLAWWLGLVLFVVMLALLLLRSGTALVRGDWEGLHRLAGARSAIEEAEAEAAYAHDEVAAASGPRSKRLADDLPPARPQ
jgi:hypothetical protein